MQAVPSFLVINPFSYWIPSLFRLNTITPKIAITDNPNTRIGINKFVVSPVSGAESDNGTSSSNRVVVFLLVVEDFGVSGSFSSLLANGVSSSISNKEGVVEGDGITFASGVVDGVTSGVAEGVTSGVAEGVTPGAGVGVTSGAGVGVTSGVGVGVTFGVGVGVTFGVGVGVTFGVGVGVTFGVGVGVTFGVGVGVTFGVAVVVGVGVTSGNFL